MSNTEQTVKIPYVQNAEMPPCLVTGVFGGLSPIGEDLMIQFYVDRPRLPEYDQLVIAPSTGNVLSQNQHPSNPGHERLVVFSAAMPIQAVKMMRDWLEVRIKEYEAYKQ